MLGKPLERGQRITVHLDARGVIRARAKWTARGWIGYTNADGGPVGSAIRRRDERVTWVRGWDGEDVAAFRAQYLLVESAR